MIKRLIGRLKTLRLYFVGGQFKKRQKRNDDKYMNYLRKTAGTPEQQWERIRFVFKYPVVIISTIIGLGSIPFILICDILFFKTIFTALSTIGLGVGINYFTFYLKETREYKILNEIGEYTVKRLSIKIENILSKERLEQQDKTDITDFLDLIDKWKEYVEYADTSRISIHKRLKLEIELEKDNEKKKLLENRISSMEHNWVNNGVGSFKSVSGSTFYEYTTPINIDSSLFNNYQNKNYPKPKNVTKKPKTKPKGRKK